MQAENHLDGKSGENKIADRRNSYGELPVSVFNEAHYTECDSKLTAGEGGEGIQNCSGHAVCRFERVPEVVTRFAPDE